MASINIDQTAMGQLIGASVMNAITSEQRDLLIKGALEYLLTKNGDRYSDGKSPIQEAFNIAVRSFAMECVRNELKEGGAFTDQVKAMINEAATKAFTEQREKIVESMADAIAKGFKPSDRY